MNPGGGITRQGIPIATTDGLILVSENGRPKWTTTASAMPQVETFADLPDPTLSNNYIYYVRTGTGIWPFTRKSKGFYRCNGVTWDYGGELVESFSSANFIVYEDSKGVKVNLEDVTGSNIRYLKVPDFDVNLGEINNGHRIVDKACDSTLLVGHIATYNASGEFITANTSLTRPVIGIVESKKSLNEATVRLLGLSMPLFSGLVPGSNYFLSETSPGELTTSPPVGSGSNIQLIGVAVTETQLFVQPSYVAKRA